MRHRLRLVSALATTLITFGSLAGGANAAVSVLIQPSTDGSKTYFTVSWDSLTGSTNFGNGPWNYSSAFNHSVSSSSNANWQLWEEFGDYKSAITNEVFLRLPSLGYTVNVAGFGLYLDNDTEGGVGDDFGITFTGGSVPSSGSFVAETDTFTGGFLSMWKEGIHTGPSGSSIVVTTTPIPEPSSALLLGLGSLGLVARRRRIK